MKKAWSAASFLVIVLLSITSALCVKGAFEALASRQVAAWLQDQPRIFTSQLTDEQKDRLALELRERATERHLTVVSRDHELQESGAALYTLNVLLPASGPAPHVEPLELLGTTVLDDVLLQRVASAPPGGYAGYGNDAFQRVENMPSVRAGLYIRVGQIDSGAALGDECVLVGCDAAQFNALAGDLSDALGVAPEVLTARMSGSSSQMGLLYFFCTGAFALLAMVLCLLMVSRSLLELKTLGVRMMLGWDRADAAWNLLAVQVLQAGVIVPVGALSACMALDGFEVNGALAGFALASMAPAVLAVLLASVLATIPFISVAPVAAIRGCFSRRGFYALTAGVYLVCTVLVFAGCLYIDQPIAMYADLARVRFAWHEYENWHVMKDFDLGGARFTGDSMALSGQLYAWYAAHEDDDGVYLANTTWYGEAALRARGDGRAALRPFWYLAASPSYLRHIGVDVPAELLDRAREGTRVYLLPDAMSVDEQEDAKAFLMASRAPRDSNIVTPFMEDPRYEFAAYDAGRELFTWSVDGDLPTYANGFVIAVVTSANMVPFESESLVASGLENAYIKLDDRAASRAFDEASGLALGDSLHANFATVGHYIDGLRKSIGELLALFAAVLVVLVVVATAMVVCLVNVANRVNAREIAVKHMLGFGVWGLYYREVLFVTMLALAGMGVSVVCGSNAGVLIGMALLVVSNVAIALVMRGRSAGVVLDTISKG